MISPNAITIARIFLALLFPFLITQQALSIRLTAAVLEIIAGVSDLFDGYLARKYKKETTFGKILDPIADKVLNLGAMLSFAYLKLYPFWLLIPIVVREIGITFIRLRCLMKQEVIAAERAGKIKTAVQSFSLFITFVYLVFRDHTQQTFFIQLFKMLNYGVLLTAVFVTLYSGYQFFKNNRSSLLSEFLATSFYVGYLRPAPGTWGSLAGILVYFLMPKGNVAYLAALVIITLFSVWAADDYAKKSHLKDPGQVVIDEVVGILVTYCFLSPLGWPQILAGFFLFRIFDVWKPLFIRKLEHLPGGWGIMMDDVAAGVFANLATRLIFLVLMR